MMELALTAFEERLLSEIADPSDSFALPSRRATVPSTATGTASCSSPQSLMDAAGSSAGEADLFAGSDANMLLPESIAGCGWNPESLEFLLETDEDHSRGHNAAVKGDLYHHHLNGTSW